MQLWRIKAWTPRGFWRCAVVSCSNMLAADLLSPVSCEMGPPWIWFDCPANPTDAQLDCDLGNLEAKTTPWTCYVPHTIPSIPCCAVRGHSHEGILLLRGVLGLKQCETSRQRSPSRKYTCRPNMSPPLTDICHYKKVINVIHSACQWI